MTQSTKWNEFWRGWGRPQGQCPRKAMLSSWRRGFSLTAACHLGRATRRTANHAYANWSHAIAWTAILTGATLMHPYLTVGSTVIYTAAMSYYTWSDAHLVDDGSSASGFRALARGTYERGLSWRKLVGDDGTTLAVIAVSMFGGGILTRRAPAMRELAFIATWSASLFTSLAVASYFAQEM